MYTMSSSEPRKKVNANIIDVMWGLPNYGLPNMNLVVGEVPKEAPTSQLPDDMQSRMKEMFENSDPETRRMMEETARGMKAGGGAFNPLAAMAGMGMGGMPGLGDMFGGHNDHTHGPNCSHQH